MSSTTPIATRDIDLAGPLPSHRFAVFFLTAGVVSNPIDIRFQRVSGLQSTVKTTTVTEGGENLFTHRVPTRVDYGNLVLERGFTVGSPLNLEFEVAMGQFKFIPSTVLVTLLGEEGAPLASWIFLKAYPVRWATADLNANEEKVLIDTLEFAYTRMQPLRL